MENDVGFFFLQALDFVLCGALLSFVYEFFRFSRALIHHNSFIIGVQDVFYLTFCGIVIFLLSMQESDGRFRLYFLIFALVGAIIYHLSIGKLFYLFYKRFIVKLRRWIYHSFYLINRKIKGTFVLFAHKIKKPFVRFSEFGEKMQNNSKRVLKNDNVLMYNDKGLLSEEGERIGTRQRIKAKQEN